MGEPLRILMVEDSEDDATLLARELKRGGYDLQSKRVDTPHGLYLELEKGCWDIVISDYAMPGFSGLDALEIFKEFGADLPFIIVSGTIGEDVAVEAMKAGAHDYVMKDNLKRLTVSVKRELREAGMRRERKKAVEALKESEERYRRLFDNANDIVYTINMEGRFTSANKAAELISGYSHDEIVNMNISENLAPESLDLVNKMIQRKLDGTAETTVYELEFIAKDGRRVQIEVSSRLIYKDKRPIGVQAIARDITERKMAENELKRSKQNISAILKTVGEGVIVIGLDSRIHYFNQELLHIFGYSMEEVVGLHITELMPEKYRAAHNAGIKRYLDDGTPKVLGRRVELEGLRKDGSVFPLEIRIEETRLDEKNRFFTAAIRDITERKLSEESLMKSEKRYRTLIENTPICVHEIDLNGRLNSMNVAGLRMMEIEKESEIKGIAYIDAVCEEDKERIGALLDRALKGHSSKFEFTSSGDDPRIFSSCLIPIFGDAQTVVKLMGVTDDITKRKKAEEELSRLHTAIENSAETMIITDVQGAIQYVNPAFELTTGYSKEEAIGLNARILKSGKHDETFYKNMWDIITSGEVWHGRMINKKKSGELYEEESTISPIKDNTGAITGYVAVKRDVTKEVLLEKELRETQKLNAIGTLAGGIAHDLNNILTPILGYSTMAKDIAPKDSETGEFLDEIISAGHRAKELVKQILTFSRRGEQDFQSLEVYLIVKEVLKLMKATIPATIKIVENIDTEPAYILGDPTQIHQVVVNLCTNAAYAMKDKGGVLTVTLRRKRLKSAGVTKAGSRVSPDYVKLSVRDTGCGMDPATLERIFEPFYTTKPEGEGTGLGLSVIHGIVESHSGHIDVESQPGEGTAFHVLLPSIEQLPCGKSAKEAEYKKGKGRALVVDDQVDVAKTIGKIMNFLGYETAVMTDSQEALNLFTENPDIYDFVITDMTMPKMTGDKLAREILKLRQDIPVVVMTGYSDTINKEKAREIGIRALIPKPVTSHELGSILGRELTGQ